MIYFNPGCALSIYKPEMEDKLLAYLNEHYGPTEMHKICCHHDPQISPGSLVICVCSGCSRRLSSLYEGIETVSLWEIIDQKGGFPLPDYDGMELSVHDTCPAREKPQVHKAVRSLLQKMNIQVVEAEHHGARSVCCGDDFYPSLPIEEVNKRMTARASSMPCEEVCVYCVSCIKSMYIGGKKPRYLADLLMGERTEAQIYDTEAWHRQLDEYKEEH